MIARQLELKMSHVKNRDAACALMGAFAVAMICSAAWSAVRPDIQLEDVNRFSQVYDASDGIRKFTPVPGVA